MLRKIFNTRIIDVSRPYKWLGQTVIKILFKNRVKKISISTRDMKKLFPRNKHRKRNITLEVGNICNHKTCICRITSEHAQICYSCPKPALSPNHHLFNKDHKISPFPSKWKNLCDHH